MKKDDIFNLNNTDDLPDDFKDTVIRKSTLRMLLDLFDIKNILTINEVMVGAFRQYNLKFSKVIVVATIYNLIKRGFLKKVGRSTFELVKIRAPKVKETPNIIDFSADKRVWGHDFQLFDKIDDEGKVWKICGWCKGIKKGDCLILGLDRNVNKAYKIIEIKYESNPSDMFFATIEWVSQAMFDKDFADKETKQ